MKNEYEFSLSKKIKNQEGVMRPLEKTFLYFLEQKKNA